MDRTYRFFFADGNQRIFGIHNGKFTDEPMSLADILLYIVMEGDYSLNDIVKIELISEEVISKDLFSGKCRKVKLN